jgi:polyphosphate kinase
MKQLIPRDISWLSFNARVLQEANDPTVPLQERIRFLGIHSNNLDEFFRVRVATLRRMVVLGGKKANMHMEENPQRILDEIQRIVLIQQSEFNRIWKNIQAEMAVERIFLTNEKKLNREQRVFVRRFFDEEVRSNIIPLMIESLPQLPYLREKSIYLGIVMRKQETAYRQKFALIEVPSRIVGRFVNLPAPAGEKHIILLEDVIRFNLPYIFSYFGFDLFEAHVFKITKDAELDIDNDISTSFVQKIEKGIKGRRSGIAVRFVYDKEMDAGLLEFLMKKLNLGRESNVIPGGRIHNFRHFMDFPSILQQKSVRRKAFVHPSLQNTLRVTDQVIRKDILLHFPYHSFDSIIDLLREAAMDPDVVSIKITAYRLATNSKIINALINAVRNGKQVVVMLELRARFDEENNLEWKERLEDEGVMVLLGIPNLKVHAKLCVIKKRTGKKTIQYGFVSTGNLNEKTAKVYADTCLLTSNRNIMADINRIFDGLQRPRMLHVKLKSCKTLWVCPNHMRSRMLALIDREIKDALAGKPAGITLKINSLSDSRMIAKLYQAAKAGVKVDLIIRGIFCPLLTSKTKNDVRAISIVDEYLEHGRIMVFHNGGDQKVYVSSADWMVRNLDHRVEAAVPIIQNELKQELLDIIHIQLCDNVKARILNNDLDNKYVPTHNKRKVRSQVETFHYLLKKIKHIETGGN